MPIARSARRFGASFATPQEECTDPPLRVEFFEAIAIIAVY
jgi:hypothetical protein